MPVSRKIKYIKYCAAAAALMMLLPASSFAEIRIYLMSKIETEKTVITLGDIAAIDAQADAAKKIAAIVIPSAVYADLYCDRVELESLIKLSTDELCYIYGTAVRVYKKIAPTVEEIAEAAALETPCVKNGERVTVQVKKNGVTLEMTGNAAGDGRLDEEVPVRIRNAKILKGRVSGKNMIELVL